MMDLFNVQEYLAPKHDSQHFVKCSDLEMNCFNGRCGFNTPHYMTDRLHLIINQLWDWMWIHLA